ncbi:hypothetical protein ACKAV7_013305 [Fusarium commune]
MASLSTRPRSALYSFEAKKAYFDNEFANDTLHAPEPSSYTAHEIMAEHFLLFYSRDCCGDEDHEHHHKKDAPFFTLKSSQSNPLQPLSSPRSIKTPSSHLLQKTSPHEDSICPLETEPKKTQPYYLYRRPCRSREDPIAKGSAQPKGRLHGDYRGSHICMAITAFFGKKSKLIFIVILFVKSKDFLSAILSPTGMMYRAIHDKFYPPKPVSRKWILSLIPAYSESEEQIVKTIFSLRDNGVEPHKQVMVVILDGKPRDVRSHMTRMVREFQRPYVSLKWKKGVLNVLAGFMEDVPVIVIEKVKNAGKKDSLILCHDLFNFPRENSPLYTKLLRKDVGRDSS